MTLVGCDLHSRKQQVAVLDTTTGEVLEQELAHDGDAVERFYRALHEGVKPLPVAGGLDPDRHRRARAGPAYPDAKRPQLLPECLDKRRRGGWSGQSKQPDLRDLGACCPSAASDAVRTNMRTSRIRRMGTPRWWMAGGSLAERRDAHQRGDDSCE